MVFEYVSEDSVKLSELENEMDALVKVDKSVAILENGKIVAYWVPAKLYEQMHDQLDAADFMAVMLDKS